MQQRHGRNVSKVRNMTEEICSSAITVSLSETSESREGFQRYFNVSIELFITVEYTLLKIEIPCASAGGARSIGCIGLK